MELINKEELLELLANRYGDLEDDCGCNVRTEDGWEWLSIRRIVAIIEACDTYEE